MIMIDYKKLIQHYENIQRLENAGGLRKDICRAPAGALQISNVLKTPVDYVKI